MEGTSHELKEMLKEWAQWYEDSQTKTLQPEDAEKVPAMMMQKHLTEKKLFCAIRGLIFNEDEEKDSFKKEIEEAAQMATGMWTEFFEYKERKYKREQSRISKEANLRREESLFALAPDQNKKAFRLHSSS